MTSRDLQALDEFVQRTTPLLAATHAASLGDMADAGHRYVVSRDGLHVQFKRRWVRGSVLLAPCPAPLPFGPPPSAGPKLSCGPVPASLVREFLAEARRVAPVEVAGWIIWREPDGPSCAGSWKLIVLRTLAASGGMVRFERPQLAAGEHLVVDIHSHGRHPAFFSAQDDADDADVSIVKFAVVLGQVMESTASTAVRFCACGAFINIGGLDEILDANR